MHDVQTISALPGPSYQVKWSDVKPDLNYLRDVDLVDVNGEDNSILIGSNNGRLLIPFEIVQPAPGPGTARLPIALRTPLGWVAVNCFPNTTKSPQLSAFRARVETDENRELIDVIESSTSVDLLGIKDNRVVTQSKEDERAFRMMKATTHKLPNKNAYVSPLLWKSKDPKLPNNTEGAMKRSVSLEKKLEKDPALKERYQQSIETDIHKGYIRKLSLEEATSPSPVTYGIYPITPLSTHASQNVCVEYMTRLQYLTDHPSTVLCTRDQICFHHYSVCCFDSVKKLSQSRLIFKKSITKFWFLIAIKQR